MLSRVFDWIAPRFFQIALLVQEAKICAVIRSAERKRDVMIDVKLSANERLETEDAMAFLLSP
jgi:hypothetical protein